MKRGHPGRRLRNFLLDANLQLRYAGQMVAVSALLTGGLGWLVLHFQGEASRVVNVRVLDPTDETAQLLQAEFARTGRLLVGALIAFGVLLSLALAAWQIVTTHKIAGPLYYLGHQARRIRDGRLGTLHPLRKGDMLHTFFEEFRAMHEALRERARREADRFTRLAADAEQAGLAPLAAELRALAKERDDATR
jgi:hypothetical protein